MMSADGMFGDWRAGGKPEKANPFVTTPEQSWCLLDTRGTKMAQTAWEAVVARCKVEIKGAFLVVCKMDVCGHLTAGGAGDPRSSALQRVRRCI